MFGLCMMSRRVLLRTSRGLVLSSTFMMVRLEKSARPALASLPDAPAPYVEVWATPKLKERMSMHFSLLVLGPSTPSIYKYAFTAMLLLLFLFPSRDST